MSIEGTLHIGACTGYPSSVASRTHVQLYVTFPDSQIPKNSGAIPVEDVFDADFDASFAIDTSLPGCLDKLVGDPLRIVMKSVSADLRHQTAAFEFQLYLDALLVHRKTEISADLIGKHSEDGEFDPSITPPTLHVVFQLSDALLSEGESKGSAIMRLRIDEMVNLPRAVVESTLHKDDKVHTFDYIVALKFPGGRIIQMPPGVFVFDEPPVVRWDAAARVFLPAQSVKAILEEGAQVEIEVRRELNEDFSNFPIQDTITGLVTARGKFLDADFTKPGQSHYAADIPLYRMTDEEPIRLPEVPPPPEEPDPKKGKPPGRKVPSRNAKKKPKRTVTPKDKKQIRAITTLWQEFTDADGFDGKTTISIDLQFSHALVLKPLVPRPTLKPSDLVKKNPETRAHRLQEATSQFREAVQRLAVEIATAQVTRQDCQLAVPDFPDDLIPLLNKMPSYHVALEKLRIAISYTFSEFSLAHQAQSDQQMQMLQDILPMYLHDELGKQLPNIFVPPRKPVDPRQFLIKESNEAELMSRKDTAAELLEELLAMDLSDADAWWLYSCLMLKHCEVARAEECVRRGLTCDPTHLKLSILFASLLTRQEKYIEAINFLNSAHFMDRIVEVVLAILNGLANLPAKPILKDGESPISFAAELLDMMDVVFSEQLIAQEQTLKGESAEVLYMFGKLYYRMHDFVKAVSFLTRAVALEKTADALLLLGHIEFERERFDDAAKWLSEGLEMRFEHDAALRLGFIYIKMGEYLKAEKVLFQCSPQSASALLGLAIASINLEKYKQADELLNRATVVNPRHPDVWAHLALFSLKMKRPDEAEHACRIARKWNLTDSDLIQKLKDAQLYVEDETYEEENQNDSLQADSHSADTNSHHSNEHDKNDQEIPEEEDVLKSDDEDDNE